MSVTRRNFLLLAGAAPFASTVPLAGTQIAEAAIKRAPVSLPDKDSFAPTDVAYLNSGSTHPMLNRVRAAFNAHLAKRSLMPIDPDYDLDSYGPIKRFARLVNADVDELVYVPSTTAGEHMMAKALGFPIKGGHIVSDTLHFFGSMPLYESMARRGMEVTWVKERDGRIPLEEIAKAVREGTNLVALTVISAVNGFQHDLKAVCDIAHAKGAYVYADMVHAAGCVPLDLHATGVDFAACATYKWLMGDFGLGFLYVRKDVQAKLKRINFGYYGLKSIGSHFLPLDPPADEPLEFEFRDDAQGLFAVGTFAYPITAALNESLDYIANVGVANIQAHAQSLIDTLKEELPKRGYQVMTPSESKSPIVSCVQDDARHVLSPVLRDAKVDVSLHQNYFRVSVSVFNDENDIERLLAALPRV